MRKKLEIKDKLSLTFYLAATGQKNRKKTTVYIENIYLEKLRSLGIMDNKFLSDIFNYLLEIFLKDFEHLTYEEISQIIEGTKIQYKN